MLTETEIQKELEDCSTLLEGANYLRNLADCLYSKKSGTIESATWEVSKLSGRPYLKLIIQTQPFQLEGRTISKVYKSTSCGFLSRLEEPLEVKIGAEGIYSTGEEVTPPLKGMAIKFDLYQEEFKGILHCRVVTLYPFKEKKDSNA